LQDSATLSAINNEIYNYQNIIFEMKEKFKKSKYIYINMINYLTIKIYYI